MVGLDGVTLIETNTAFATVRVVDPTIEPDVAVMLDVPMVPAVARPAVLIVATAAVAEFHVAVKLRSCVLLSV